MRVLIALAMPAQQDVVAAELPDGATLQQGLTLLRGEIESLAGATHLEITGVWGKVRPPHYVLREGDRIEFYRPLKADPKHARRVRAGTKAKQA